MNDAASLGLVIALWLLLSLGLWWLQRRSQRLKRKRQRQLVGLIAKAVGDAQAVFDAIRRPLADMPADDAERADNSDATARRRFETTALLRRIQEQGDYFDTIRALIPRMKAELGLDDCPPLTEVMQIRRDLWASSEIILVEDLRTLGDAFAEEGAYEAFVEEAERLLFLGRTPPGEDDPIDLRLAVARADVEQFARDIEADITLAEEKERLPTPAEIVAYPVAAVRALPGQIRLASAYLWEFVESVKLAARTIRESGTLASALSEFRRARDRLPQQLAHSFDRAAALARKGGQSIAAHRDFLLKAYDLQAKYQEMLVRAPELSERGRQFVARLELAKRSEQLRERSRGILDDAKRLLVRVLAHLIALLQKAQDWLAPPEPAAAGPGYAAPQAQHSGLAAATDRRGTTPEKKPSRPDGWASAADDGRPAARSEPAPRHGDAGPTTSPRADKPRDTPLRSAGANPSSAPEEKAEPPSEETLARLRGLFSSRRRPGSPLAKPTSRGNRITPAVDAKQQTQLETPASSAAKDDPARLPAPARKPWPGLERLRRGENKLGAEPRADGKADAGGKPGVSRTAAKSPPVEPERGREQVGDAGTPRPSTVSRLRTRLFRRDRQPQDQPPGHGEPLVTTNRPGRVPRETPAEQRQSDGIAAMLRRLADEEDLAFLAKPQRHSARSKANSGSLIARLSRLDTAELEAIGYGPRAAADEGEGRTPPPAREARSRPGSRAFPLPGRRRDQG